MSDRLGRRPEDRLPRGRDRRPRAASDLPEVAGDDTPRSVALEDDDLLVAPGLATAAADKGESAVNAPLCPVTRPQCRSKIHLRTRMHVRSEEHTSELQSQS